MRISKSTKTEVKASKRGSELARSSADYMRIRLMDKGYTKNEVNSMGLPELKDACDKEGIELKFCSDIKASKKLSANDQALQHIKAAIDILGKSGDKSDITKDSIANLATVMFDLKGDK